MCSTSQTQYFLQGLLNIFAPSMFSTLVSFPVPVGDNHLQSIMLPPPSFTVHMMFLAFILHHARTFLQKCQKLELNSNPTISISLTWLLCLYVAILSEKAFVDYTTNTCPANSFSHLSCVSL